MTGIHGICTKHVKILRYSIAPNWYGAKAYKFYSLPIKITEMK